MQECRRTTLPNGLRILTASMPHTRSVSVGFFLGVGSRYEAATDAGAAHFIEHMLFKGTERWPSPAALASEIEGRGGIFNGQTGRESTNYWSKIAESHLPIALDVLTDMLRWPVFAPDEIARERRIILEEMNMALDQPDSLLSLVMNETYWPDHPLGRDVAGDKDSIANMERPRLLAFRERHYSPKNLVVSVAGHADHDDIVARLSDLLGDWEGPEPGGYEQAPPVREEPRHVLQQKDTEQAHLAMRVPGLPRGHQDRFALSILNTILGDGMSSRLFLEVRERLGLAYAVDSTTAFLSDSGVVEAYAALDASQVETTVRVILREWKRLREEPVPPDELQRAKEFNKGRMLLGMEDSLSVSGWWGAQELLRDKVMTVDEVVSALDAVMAEDIQRVAGDCFQGQLLTLGLVGPLEEDGLLPSLLDEAAESLA